MLRTLRGNDAAVLVVITATITFGWRNAGIDDPLLMVLLSIGWTTAALQRLMAWRRNESPERRLSFDDPGSAIPLLMFGILPWQLMPAAPAVFTTPMDLPLWVRGAGALLMVYGVVRPAFPGGTAGMVTINGLLGGLGLFLASGSVLVGGLILCAIVLVLSSRVTARSEALPVGAPDGSVAG